MKTSESFQVFIKATNDASFVLAGLANAITLHKKQSRWERFKGFVKRIFTSNEIV